MSLAIVNAIDRVNHRVLATMRGFQQQLKVPYAAPLPPAPLSLLDLSSIGHGVYRENRRYYDTRVVLNDDFNTVQSSTGYGDTAWHLQGSGTVAQDPTFGSGAAKITAPATAYSATGLYKDNDSLLTDTASALWFSARVSLSTASNVLIWIGLFDNNSNAFDPTTGAGAWFAFDSAADAEWIGQHCNGQTNPANSSVNVFGYAKTPNTGLVQYFDILLVPGSWVAYWVGVDGPYFSNHVVPQASQSFQPYVLIEGRTTAQPSVSVDFMHLERIVTLQPLTDPWTLTGAPRAQLFTLGSSTAGVLGQNQLG